MLQTDQGGYQEESCPLYGAIPSMWPLLVLSLHGRYSAVCLKQQISTCYSAYKKHLLPLPTPLYPSIAKWGKSCNCAKFMSGANPCISVSGTQGNSLPGGIKAERGSGQASERKPIASEKRRVQSGTSLLLSYVAVDSKSRPVVHPVFGQPLMTFFSPLHFCFSGLSRDKKEMFLHWQKGLFQPCEMCGCLASRVSALLSIAQPRAALPPPWLRSWSRVCV